VVVFYPRELQDLVSMLERARLEEVARYEIRMGLGSSRIRRSDLTAV